MVSIGIVVAVGIISIVDTWHYSIAQTGLDLTMKFRIVSNPPSFCLICSTVGITCANHHSLGSYLKAQPVATHPSLKVSSYKSIFYSSDAIVVPRLTASMCQPRPCPGNFQPPYNLI